MNDTRQQSVFKDSIEFFDDDDDIILENDKEPKEVISEDVKKEPKVSKEKDDQIYLDMDEDELEDLEVIKDKNPDKKSSRTSKNDKVELDYKSIFSSAKDVFKHAKVADDFDGSESSFVKLVEDEANGRTDTYINEILEKVNKHTHGLIEALDNGVKFEDFISTFSKTNNDESITLDMIKQNDAHAETVLRNVYKQKGFTDARIEKEIKKSKELETLKEDAEDFYEDYSTVREKELTKLKNNAKQKEEEKTLLEQERLTSIQNSVNSLIEFIPDVKLTDKAKQQILTKAQGRDVFDKIGKDPVKYRVILAALDHYGLLDGDFTKVMTHVEGKGTKMMKEKANSFVRNAENSSTRTSTQSTPEEVRAKSGFLIDRRNK